MLKKSMVNPEPPQVDEISGGSKGMPAQPAQASSRTGGSTDGALAEIKPAGRNSSTSRYTAPRKDCGSSPMECGYTKVKM